MIIYIYVHACYTYTYQTNVLAVSETRHGRRPDEAMI